MRRIHELTRENGYLREELVMYKDVSRAMRELQERTRKAHQILHEALQDTTRKLARSERRLLDYWGINLDEVSEEVAIFWVVIKLSSTHVCLYFVSKSSSWALFLGRLVLQLHKSDVLAHVSCDQGTNIIFDCVSRGDYTLLSDRIRFLADILISHKKTICVSFLLLRCPI